MCCVLYVHAQVLNIPFCILFSWGWSDVDQIFCERKPFVFNVFHKIFTQKWAWAGNISSNRFLNRTETLKLHQTLVRNVQSLSRNTWNLSNLWDLWCIVKTRHRLSLLAEESESAFFIFSLVLLLLWSLPCHIPVPPVQLKCSTKV